MLLQSIKELTSLNMMAETEDKTSHFHVGACLPRVQKCGAQNRQDAPTPLKELGGAMQVVQEALLPALHRP
eukprot:6326247-Amphidinium_carterae.1